MAGTIPATVAVEYVAASLVLLVDFTKVTQVMAILRSSLQKGDKNNKSKKDKDKEYSGSIVVLGSKGDV